MNKFDFIIKCKALVDNTRDVLEIVNSFEEMSDMNKRAYIDESFFNIIEYSSKNIPYYRKILNERGYVSKDFTTISSISKLPILTKEDIRRNFQNLRPHNLNNLSYSIRRSGGTTGEPIESLISKRAKAFENFSFYKGLSWCGWNPKMTLVKLMGGSLGIGSKFSIRQKIDQFARNSIHVPAFFLNNENIFYYQKLISKYKNVCLLGYPSAISNFVDLLKSNKLYLKNVDLALTTSEQLNEDWFINIKNYLNCNIRSYYGMGEILSIGYQLENKDNAYKIPTEHIYVESENNTNQILLTQLHNLSQPLIRYAPGDLVKLDKKKYPNFITEITGRTSDYFIRKNGSKVSPIFGTYSIQKSGIKVEKYQYVQRHDDKIEFRYIMKNRDLSKDEKNIIKNIVENVMQEKVELLFARNKKFELSKSEKHRICVRL